MSVTTNRFIARSQISANLLRDMQEEWKVNHQDAIRACDVEEIGEEFLGLFGLLQQAWPPIESDFFIGAYGLTKGRKLIGAIAISIAAAERFFAEEADKVHHEYGLKNYEALKDAVGQARAILLKASDFWPTKESRLAKIASSRDQFLRSEFVGFSELANAEANGSSGHQ